MRTLQPIQNLLWYTTHILLYNNHKIRTLTTLSPTQPAPLSVTHSATQEDLKRDKEAAASRIKHFLSEDEERRFMQYLAPISGPLLAYVQEVPTHKLLVISNRNH